MPRALRAISSEFISWVHMRYPSTTLHMLTLWAICLVSVSDRLYKGTALFPLLIQGTTVCLWVIARPRWGPLPQLGPVPHLPLSESMTVSAALQACAAELIRNGAICSIYQPPRLVTGLLYHMPAPSNSGPGVPVFCPKIQTEHVTKALVGKCFGYRESALMEKVVLTSSHRRHDCSEAAQPPMLPASHLPLDLDPYLVVYSPLVTGSTEVLDQDVRHMDSLSELTLLTLNCGGAERKAIDIIATLSELAVNIAFL